MQIGSLAKLVGKSEATLRYYEEIGLLEPPQRTEAGYRQYSPEAVQRVRFITDAQEYGFSLREIKDVLRLSDHGTLPCIKVSEIARGKVRQIDQEIARLRKRRAVIVRALALYDSGSLDETPFCPILDTSNPHHQEVKKS